MRTWQTQSRLRGVYFLSSMLIGSIVWLFAAMPIYKLTPTMGPMLVTVTPSASITPTGYVPSNPNMPMTVAAVFQPFETGWMLWRADDNYVYVFQTNSWVQSYPLTELAATLTSTSPTLTIPPDRVPTAATFAALWQADRWGIAPLIGWATAPAVQYQATVFAEEEFGFEISTPDGEHLRMAFGGRWHLGGVSGGSWGVTGAQPTFVPASFPTLIPTPLPTPLTTQAIYQEFEHGFMLTRLDSTCAYAYSYADSPAGRIVIPREISALPFGNYKYCLDFSTLPDVLIVEPTPNGQQSPIGNLGKVWRYYQDVRTALGYATAPEQPYLAAIPYNACTDEFSCSYMPPILALPDGRVLSCGMRAASGGSCTVK